MQRQRCRWRDDEALEADLEETLSLDSNSTTVDVHATLRLRLWLGRFDIAGGVFEGTVDTIRDAEIVQALQRVIDERRHIVGGALIEATLRRRVRCDHRTHIGRRRLVNARPTAHRAQR